MFMVALFIITKTVNNQSVLHLVDRQAVVRLHSGTRLHKTSTLRTRATTQGTPHITADGRGPIQRPQRRLRRSAP